MARLHFRTTVICLDADEDVASIVAVADGHALAVIREFVPDVTVSADRRGHTEFDVALTTPEMLELFWQVGKVTGDGHRSAASSDIHDSLSVVVYRLVED